MEIDRYPESYCKLFEKVTARDIKKIIIIGGIDSGKSHLVRDLSIYLSRKYRTAIVDLDVGQSHIGPPTTIAWGVAPKKFKGWDNIKPKNFYFAGVISPSKNMLRFISGVKIITDIASSRSQKTVIDTTGLVRGKIGRILKQTKIDILQPDVIIALNRSNELAQIIYPYRKTKKPILIELPILDEVRDKSPAIRAKYRNLLFKRYFKNNRIKFFDIHKTSLLFSERIEEITEDRLKHRIVSLRDKNNVDRILGIIKFLEKDKIAIMVKRHPLFHVSMIVIGQEKWEPTAFW